MIEALNLIASCYLVIGVCVYFLMYRKLKPPLLIFMISSLFWIWFAVPGLKVWIRQKLSKTR